MTTSYELSLKLKEIGVEQEGGEYYWVCFTDWQFNKVTMETLETFSFECVRSNEPHIKAGEILCRALTLGEVVRVLGKDVEFEIKFINHEHGKEVFARRKNYLTGRCSRTEKEHAPEEVAGELLCETLKQKA